VWESCFVRSLSTENRKKLKRNKEIKKKKEKERKKEKRNTGDCFMYM